MIKKDLEKLYDDRYSLHETEERYSVFEVICKEYFVNFLPEHSSEDILVDIAAGHCDFINNIPYKGKKFAFDLNEYSKENANENVTVVIDDVMNLKKHFDNDSVSMFFSSNFLEHIPKETIQELFSQCYSLLKPKGELWILIPNIRFIGGDYWDYFDHITPITDRSIIEVAEMHNFKLKTAITKFIPYSMKYSKKPRNPTIVKLYLSLMPLSGYFFGQQSFLIFKKV